MSRKKVSVISESKSGRNKSFRDNYSGESMSRAQFVKAIEGGNYPKYHVRKINGVKTPVSNPDSKHSNNLG
ncbi:hypothetical protein [Grimontia sp. NTOU-MAR1]|uniref:hypothetical protein n=1 Tax=Grimontia sp. NTOU-MAR1 TaxID=3111011 RepID=UPI002DB9D07A|nr:hypothetical protein [Grimontia sp. NTOU-MAR1]WRV96405.1 hypothetical protein VP504_09705 [Grimontia sp. NTOU-MAR1]